MHVGNGTGQRTERQGLAPRSEYHCTDLHCRQTTPWRQFLTILKASCVNGDLPVCHKKLHHLSTHKLCNIKTNNQQTVNQAVATKWVNKSAD